MKTFLNLLALLNAVFISSFSPAACFADDGWVSLFDGTTLAGWKQAEHGQAEYKVLDRTIYGKTVEGSPNSFLMSEKQYGDFELEFEVKVHDELNSGCQIRSRGKTSEDLSAETSGSNKDKKKNRKSEIGRFFGPQVELEASPGQAGYVYGEATGRGWLSPEPQDKKHSHSHMKNGEWNQIRILAKGARIQTWINSEPVADIADVAIFKTHPQGHLGLQVHGIETGTGPFDVAWRNIRIREL